jgi:putative tryptophan/tyrosine transport system substrate-binding protein
MKWVNAPPAFSAAAGRRGRYQIMKRREFLLALTMLIGGIRSGPFAAGERSATMPVIGFLNFGSARVFANFLAAFQQGLNAAGYVEGQNVAIEYRWANGDFRLLREQAADLVNRKVTLIVATGGLVSARAAKDATDTIPIVYIGGADPVAEGLVTSINRPIGNVTGVNLYVSELIPKRLELLRELVPRAEKFAVIINPITPSGQFERLELERVASQTRLPLLVLEASSESELKQAFDSAVRAGAGALLVSPDGFFTSQRAQIVDLAATHSLPVAYGTREFVAAGGLMSYGPSIPDAYRQIGDYAARILRGAKPTDLPVQQPTRFDLVLNVNTAKALGIDVPYPLLITASEVIE